MKILVTKNQKASANTNGNIVIEYKAGEVYEIYQELAEVFLRENWGEQCIENHDKESSKKLIEANDKAITAVENKAVEKTPENKAQTRRR